MYQFTRSGNAPRSRRTVLTVLMVGLLSGQVFGDDQARLWKSAKPQSDKPFISGVDPDAGILPTLMPKRVFIEPPPQDELRDAMGQRGSCSCESIGAYLYPYPGNRDVFRGNIYTIDETGTNRELCEFKMELNMPGDTELCFYVYKFAGDFYELIYENRKNVVGEGLKFYSTGTIIDVVLTAGETYMVGVAWADEVSIAYGRDYLTYPQDCGFGIVEGRFGVQSGCPQPSPLPAGDVSSTTSYAYSQEVCFEPPPGACCQGATCTETTASECAGLGGQYTAPGISCGSIACPLPIGACCFGEFCAQYTELECQDRGGEYLGVTNSSGVPPMGDYNSNGLLDGEDYAEFAICFDYGNGPASFPGELSCTDVCTCDSSGLSCDTNGLYGPLGEECLLDCDCDSSGLSCYGEPKLDPAGYCLDYFDFDASGTIDLADFAWFQIWFGVFPDVNQCDGDPCLYERAPCCLYGGECVNNLTEAECAAYTDSQWQPDLTTCGPCTTFGACCLGETCFEEPLSACQPGAYNWCPGLHCEEVNCPVNGVCPDPSALGACCLFNGDCAMITELACTNTNGTYHGAGTTCGEVTCPVFGACCAGNYCLELEDDDCPEGDGFVWNIGERCDPSPCPGACCDENDDCQIMEADVCTSAPVNGTYAGNGVPCEFDTCPLWGACCIGTLCVESDPPTCDGLSGDWYGGEECATFTCP